MKERHEFVLQFRGQIDQEVAADNNIQLGKGSVHDDVLRGKGNHFPDLFTDPVAVAVLDKKTLQPFGSQFSRDFARIDRPTGNVYAIPVQICGKDLQGEMSTRINRV